jgi:glycerophosphoryl diester phosphodiesterase
MDVIGHGGAGLEFSGSVYHGNSSEAMKYALNMPNCNGVEMDIRMASDGTLWLSHDETLNDETNASGCVGDKVEEELKEVHYKTLKKEKLANLTDLEFFRKGNQLLFLDIKHSNFCQGNIQNASEFMESLNVWRSTIENSNERVKIILNNSAWVSSFLSNGYKVLFSSDDLEQKRQLMKDFPEISGFVSKNSLCTENEVDEIKKAGKTIYLYEVRSPKALKEVRKKRPTGVMSDDLQGAIIEFK